LRILVVDNYDSFTFNLVDALARAGAQVDVVKNDAISGSDSDTGAHDAVVISPGPCTPAESGASLRVAERAVRGELGRPLFGVCLGHQAVGVALGASLVRATRPVHGETSAIFHDGTGAYADLPQGFAAARYNSLVIERSSLPGELRVVSWTGDDEVMGLRHRTLPIFTVQFHPESFMTAHGPTLLSGWLREVGRG
jgi:anthranilate synthase component 2